MLGLTTYIQSTTSTLKTDVLVLELKHFDRILIRRNPRIVESMKSGLELRLSARISSRKVERSIPLLLKLRSMAEKGVEEQRRREAARASDHLRRRRRKQSVPVNDGKTTSPDFSRRLAAVGSLLSRIAVVKADAVLELDRGGDAAVEVEEMEGDGDTSTLAGSRVDTVTDPLSSEEMLTELEDRIGCFVTSISADSSSLTSGTNSRSQSPCKTERLRRAINPVSSMRSRRRY